MYFIIARGVNSAVWRHESRVASVQESNERLSQMKVFRQPERNSLDKHIIKAFGTVAILSKSVSLFHSVSKISYMGYT